MSSAIISDYFSKIALCLGIFFSSVYYNSGLLFLIDVSKIICLSSWGNIIIPFGLKLYQDNASVDGVFLFTTFFYINRLVFSDLSQNIGESATFFTLMEHSWYICFSRHWISGNSSYCCASITAKAQLCSSKLFCHIGLETYISLHPSLILDV